VHFSLAWLALLPAAIACFRTEWMGMYQSLRAAIKPQPACPQPE
jgi:hypothetical protein